MLKWPMCPAFYITSPPLDVSFMCCLSMPTGGRAASLSKVLKQMPVTGKSYGSCRWMGCVRWEVR